MLQTLRTNLRKAGSAIKNDLKATYRDPVMRRLIQVFVVGVLVAICSIVASSVVPSAVGFIAMVVAMAALILFGLYGTFLLPGRK